MALQCICFPVNSPQVQGRMQKPQNGQQKCCKDQNPKEKFDICKILDRTQRNEESKHNELECHTRGENRQNLINKLKMFLDDYEDRPVMKSRAKEDALQAKGQTGFGPMIKYPGYVDYDHPYFSSPYNRMPELAQTVGQRTGENPCPPISMRNFESTMNKQGGADNYGAAQSEQVSQYSEGSDGRCQCARRRGVQPTCPAAVAAPRARRDAQQWDQNPLMGPPIQNPRLGAPLQPYDQSQMVGQSYPGVFMCVCCPAQGTTRPPL